MQTEEIQSVESLLRGMNQPIWIVSSQSNGRRSGLTATWIHQASIDRDHPTMLLGLAPNHFTCEILLQSGYCVVHLLKTTQSQVAWEFSQPSSRERDKFAGFDVAKFKPVDLNAEEVSEPIPYLADCHSALACKTIRTFDAGDRIYFLAEIESVIKTSPESCLRESDFFGDCTPQQLEKLKSDLKNDVQIQRPLLAEWKQNK